MQQMMFYEMKYSSIDTYVDNYACRGDVISFLWNGTKQRGTVVGIQGDNIFINLGGREVKIVNNIKYTCEERYITKVGISNIPVEVNDLVTVSINDDLVVGVVTKLVPPSKVDVLLMQDNTIYQCVVVDIKHLRFRTKGYLPKNTKVQIAPNGLSLPQQKLTSAASTTKERTPIEVVKVSAPCVIKVISPNQDPNQYADVMQVTFSDGSEPLLLPLIRIQCGNMIFVDKL